MTKTVRKGGLGGEKMRDRLNRVQTYYNIERVDGQK